MKFFFLILSFYMLYLCCLPCGDKNECAGKQDVNVSVNDNHQQHNHEQEACTPFCSCSCCAATAYYMPLSKTQMHGLFQTKIYPNYKVNFNADAFYPIWQPPKLAV